MKATRILLGAAIAAASFILLVIFGAIAAPARAQVTAVSGWDHLSIGATSYTGFHAGAQWRGAELTYRHAEGQGFVINGGSADYYLRWRNYFVTGGASYLDIGTKTTHRREFAPRAGIGLQFGPLRTAMRYERINGDDGVTLSVGLAVALGGGR